MKTSNTLFTNFNNRMGRKYRQNGAAASLHMIQEKRKI